MKNRYVLLEARIYLRDWGMPFSIILGLIVTFPLRSIPL
jgi:hypothetical protein